MFSFCCLACYYEENKKVNSILEVSPLINTSTTENVLIKVFRNDSEREFKVSPKTIKGKGFSFSENNNDWHHAPLSKSQYEIAINSIESRINERVTELERSLENFLRYCFQYQQKLEWLHKDLQHLRSLQM